ncbi:MAG: hypothetical protein ACK4ND_15710 [Cytophagaceae bacterium]
MNTKFKSVMLMAIAVFTFSSCNSQTAGCCVGDKSKTSCSKNCSTSKKESKITTDNATCPKCGKNSCDTKCSASTSTDTTSEGAKLKAMVPSCNLSESQMVSRKAELTSKYGMFLKVKEVIELKDGYDFVFTEPKEFSQQLLDFINFERNCCSNFSFALEFEPNEKATHLKIYGSKAIKTELKTGFTELGVLKK